MPLTAFCGGRKQRGIWTNNYRIYKELFLWTRILFQQMDYNQQGQLGQQSHQKHILSARHRRKKQEKTLESRFFAVGLAIIVIIR